MDLILSSNTNNKAILTRDEYDALKLQVGAARQTKQDLKEAAHDTVELSRAISNDDKASYIGSAEEVMTYNDPQDVLYFAESYDSVMQNGKIIARDTDKYNQDVDYDQLDRDTQSDDGDSRYYHLKGGSYE
tara:strand:+ start:642 stop:1034 length:393 start_codon:yes stop_codon:yes gene_type:complete